MKTSKKTEILNCAQELIQRRGFNGFSYADIAHLIGIRKASIHHYFPTKADLGIAVVERYRELFNLALDEIDLEKSLEGKINRYVSLYKDVLKQDRLCLCGMLASDLATLEPELQAIVKEFFLDNVAWLSKVLTDEYPSRSKNSVSGIAWQIINSLQGATLISRIMNDTKAFDANCDTLMHQLRQIK
ncbi:TetR family transcriptional regulator [Legionella steigerwaltii]|uniref:TetR family transcriptional regulator n=1 Tax=Legionella steigerwaltii TaxID=460 RepID=A0A378LDH1_9GAMM|nr:TetR/AcrR family transcriptional regulator [Legionella steigerwaltii]KTD78023.1 TetR family transcriptional regulator [Legionella steigerwaltii]STY24420.1 TetR family transcriptional regulator [Legionella steigerwaltii]